VVVVVEVIESSAMTATTVIDPVIWLVNALTDRGTVVVVEDMEVVEEEIEGVAGMEVAAEDPTGLSRETGTAYRLSSYNISAFNYSPIFI